MTKVCLECAASNRFKWLPCQSHNPAIVASSCDHETISFLIHANAAATCEATICHGCGTITDNCEGGQE